DPAGDLRDLGDDLDRARTGADHRDPFAGQVVLVLPARGVEGGPAKSLETGPVGHARDVQEPDRADQHVTRRGRAVVEVEGVGVRAVVPHGTVDADTGPDVRAQPEVV